MSGDPLRTAAATTSTAAVSALRRPLAQLRARLTVVTSAALFLLPLPLLFVIATALIADDTTRLTLATGALACVWTAGVLTWRGLANEMRYLLGDQADLDRVPRKALAGVLTAGGAGLAALTAGHSAIGVATFAAMGWGGHFCLYGFDRRAPRIAVTAVDGLDVTGITRQLEQAHLRLRRIDAAARSIAVPEFRTRLARITALGREILAEIAREPRNATRARRFLSLFLDGTERVTEEYARTHQGIRSRPLEEQFRRLLVDMERTFSEQHRKLLESDAVSLDVEMEVLNARLTPEREGAPVERRL